MCVCLCVSVCAEVGGRTAKNKDKCFLAHTLTQPSPCLGWWLCLHLALPACSMLPHTQPQCTVLPNPTVEPRPWEAGAAQPSLPQHRSSSSWKQNSNNNGKKIIYIYISPTSLKDPNGWNQSPTKPTGNESKSSPQGQAPVHVPAGAQQPGSTSRPPCSSGLGTSAASIGTRSSSSWGESGWARAVPPAGSSLERGGQVEREVCDPPTASLPFRKE